MGLSRTVSEINSDLSRKLQIFPNPCILRHTALESINQSFYFSQHGPYKNTEKGTDGEQKKKYGIGIGARGQTTRMIGLSDGPKSFKIGLAV